MQLFFMSEIFRLAAWYEGSHLLYIADSGATPTHVHHHLSKEEGMRNEYEVNVHKKKFTLNKEMNMKKSNRVFIAVVHIESP